MADNSQSSGGVALNHPTCTPDSSLHSQTNNQIPHQNTPQDLDDGYSSLSDTSTAPSINTDIGVDWKSSKMPYVLESPTLPFELPKAWKEAMSMASVNAGLRPHEILVQYYRQQPLQMEHSYTDLDLTSAVGAVSGKTSEIDQVTIRYENNDPSKIYLMLLVIHGTDPTTNSRIVRAITNTSINHVLEKQPGANCPLWLKVHDANHKPSSKSYDIIPCCSSWVEDVDVTKPISDEEKKLPEVSDRVFKQARGVMLRQKVLDKELEELRMELQGLKELAKVETDREPKVGESLVTKVKVMGRGWTLENYMLWGVIFFQLAILVFKL